MMKFCKDCANFESSTFCRAPENGVDLLTSETKLKSASFSRTDFGVLFKPHELCGVNAQYFKQKVVIPVVKNPWWRFWK